VTIDTDLAISPLTAVIEIEASDEAAELVAWVDRIEDT
jgi:hypothetical protein